MNQASHSSVAASESALLLGSRLRHDTAAQHQALEEAIAIPLVLRDAKSYQHLLEKFYGFYLPIEKRLLALSPPCLDIDLEGRRKAGWLEQDLRALGMRDPHDLPLCADLPDVRTPATVLGASYVLEGATLGGRQVRALLAASPLAGFPQRFFTSYGAEVGAKWASFSTELNRYSSAPEADAIVQSARATFEKMHRWVMS